MSTLADGQLPIVAAALITGQQATNGGQWGPPAVINGSFCNTSASLIETVTLTFQRQGGTSRRVARWILNPNESGYLVNQPIQFGDTLLGITTDASVVDYMITAGNALGAFQNYSLTANGALKSANPSGIGSYNFGGGIGTFSGEGNINSQPSQPGLSPASTGGDYVIATYTLPASSFDIAGRTVYINATGSWANNNHSKTVKIIYAPTTANIGSTVTGGTTIASIGAVTDTGGVGWALEATVVKYGGTGSNTQLGIHSQAQSGSTIGSLIAPSALNATESGAITIAVTGNAATTATDILLSFFVVNACN